MSPNRATSSLPICSVRVVGTGDAKPIKRHMFMPFWL